MRERNLLPDAGTGGTRYAGPARAFVRERSAPCHPPKHTRRPAGVWILLVLLLIQGLGGLAGGLSLTLRPDGSIMKMPLSYLDGSPFSDFLIPGLILLLVLGVLPLVAVAGLWMRRTLGLVRRRSPSAAAS